jgi:enamine deaminase RidA (YjgF/YER057c/UK114 family)
MLRKQSSAGIGYSVVALNDVRHVFAAAVPRNGGGLKEQADDALRTIEAVIDEEGVHGSIVHQAVFVSDPANMEACRKIIHDFYGSKLPATTYICQPPCCGKLVSIEALGVGQKTQPVEIERISERLVITGHSGVKWIHCGQIVPQTTAPAVYDRSLTAFEEMRRLLESTGTRFNQVIRTWLYLGDIVGPEGETQRYKELNRARSDFFRDLSFGDGRLAPGIKQPVFPASTGIGTSNRDVVMSCIALSSTRDDIQLIPLENPLQVSAFDYSAHYSPKSPKFARAMAVTCGRFATIFISGTASITASETRYLDDAAGQTRQTLDNIEALISERNFLSHGMPGLGSSLDHLAIVRVYIKRPEDYAKVRAVCEARLGELPTIYAIADVCRPELLVEIEGIAVSQRQSS